MNLLSKDYIGIISDQKFKAKTQILMQKNYSTNLLMFSFSSATLIGLVT